MKKYLFVENNNCVGVFASGHGDKVSIVTGFITNFQKELKIKFIPESETFTVFDYKGEAVDFNWSKINKPGHFIIIRTGKRCENKIYIKSERELNTVEKNLILKNKI